MPELDPYPLQILFILFLLAVGLQLAFFLVFLIALRRSSPGGEAGRVPVSVIVCAHDEAENLRELIPLLLSQEYPDFEVVIVNDRSNDSTLDLLLQESGKDSRVRMVHVRETPQRVNAKKYALTLGIKAATHDWLLFTDADCRPRGTQWISTMSRYFDDETRFVLGFSPYMVRPGFLNLFIRFEALLTAIQYFAFGWMKNPYMGVGRNLAYRKSFFLAEKGFNNLLHVTGGDDDLFVNLHAKGDNTRLELSPESQMLSVPERTWASFYWQKVRHLSVGKRYRAGHRFLLGLLGLSWIVLWPSWIGLLAGLSSADHQALVSEAETYLILVPFLLRWILLLLLFRSMTRRTALNFSLWTLPVLDLVYAIYYLVTGLAALMTKRIRWRN